MVEIAVTLPANYIIQTSAGEVLPRDDAQLYPGRYLIVSNVPVVPSPQPFFTRAMSTDTGTRLQSFRDEVRARDGRCVVSKRESFGRVFGWAGHQAAHIVPLAYANEWRRRGFANLITIPPPPPYQRDTINSVQYGILLDQTLHSLFDSYGFSILPKAGYKILFFRPSVGLNFSPLDRILLDDERRPLDAFLEWHFEQAVLCNVRGAGEPAMEFDFPPGSDMMGEILRAPKAAERLEFELFTRLGASAVLDPGEE